MEHILTLPNFDFIDRAVGFFRKLRDYIPALFDELEGDDGDDDDAGDDDSNDGDAGDGDDHTGADDDSGSGDEDDGDGDDGGQDEDDDPTAALQQEIEDLKQQIQTIQPKPSGTEDTTDTGKPSVRDTRVEYDDPNHAYHGKTFGQIYDLDPDEAFRVSPAQANRLQLEEFQQEQHAADAEKRALEQIDNERSEFAEYFKGQNESASAAQVEKATEVVEEWMLKEGKYGITVKEAHILMNLDSVASKAAGKVIKDAQRGNVRDISTKKDSDPGAKPTDMSKWTAAQLSDHLDSLNEAAYVKFLSNAPESVRKKHPNLPWG